MTAEELIKHLQLLPPQTKIVVRGYENGYNDVINLTPRKIKLNADSDWYDGEYIDSKETDAVEAIDLFGDNKNDKTK